MKIVEFRGFSDKKKLKLRPIIGDFFSYSLEYKEVKIWNKMLGADFSFILLFALNKSKYNQN